MGQRYIGLIIVGTIAIVIIIALVSSLTTNIIIAIIVNHYPGR